MSHDIVQLAIVQYHVRAHPVTLVAFFQVAEKGWKRLSWIKISYQMFRCEISPFIIWRRVFYWELNHS